jgi:hypothetical protein
LKKGELKEARLLDGRGKLLKAVFHQLKTDDFLKTCIFYMRGEAGWEEICLSILGLVMKKEQLPELCMKNAMHISAK